MEWWCLKSYAKHSLFSWSVLVGQIWPFCRCIPLCFLSVSTFGDDSALNIKGKERIDVLGITIHSNPESSISTCSTFRRLVSSCPTPCCRIGRYLCHDAHSTPQHLYHALFHSTKTSLPQTVGAAFFFLSSIHSMLSSGIPS